MGLALAFLAGLATLAAPIRPPLPLLLPLCLAAPILAWWRPSVAGASTTAFLAGVVAASAAALGAGQACHRRLASSGGRTAVAVEGIFIAAPAPGRRSAPFSVFRGPGGCRGEIRVVLPREHRSVLAGDPMTVVGRWLAATDGRGLQGLLFATEIRTAATHRQATFVTVHRFRQRVEERLRTLFPRRWALVHALVLARKDGLDPDLREGFAVTGLAHLLAISGFHVGVVAGMLLALVRGIGAGVRTAAVIAAVGVWAYVASIGAPDAAVRAASLLSVGALARARGRPVHAIGALATAFLAMSWVDPSSPARVGFQLSFAGAAGLVLWAGPLARWMARGLPRRLPRSTREAVAAGTAATVATLPLVAWHFERVSLVGIPATLLVGPLVAAAIPGVFSSLVLSAVSPPLAAFIAGGVEWVLDGVVEGVQVLAGLPWASLPVGRGSVLVAALAFAGVPRWLGKRGRASRVPRRRVAWAAGLAAAIAWPAAVSLAGSGALEVVFLDVGQGDAIAVRSPRGRWILVDAGPRSETRDAGARVVAPFFGRRGVGRLSALVLTHPDLDHIGGAPAVLDALDVDVVFDPGFATGRSPFVNLLERAADDSVPWLAMSRGRRLAFDGVELLALHPPPSQTRGGVGLEANDRSVVLRVTYGAFSLLLTGDVEREGEAQLVASGALAPVQILKVAHHGSGTSTTGPFLEETLPEVAVVSVGGRNRYGHPDAGVLARLEALGTRIYRTDRHGQVTLLARRDGTFRIRTERSAGVSGPGRVH